MEKPSFPQGTAERGGELTRIGGRNHRAAEDREAGSNPFLLEMLYLTDSARSDAVNLRLSRDTGADASRIAGSLAPALDRTLATYIIRGFPG